VNWDETDIAVMRFIQGDLPLQSRPYADLARQLGITDLEIVERRKSLKDRGAIRRVAAVLRHQKAGYTVNAMVAWKVSREDADSFAAQVIDTDRISHCYWRDTPPDFAYSMFTMLHCHSDEEMDTILKNISRRTKVTEYVMLRSIKEFKKESMKYF
jgi:DNA-binding Lrp family transcriptional regulator